MHGISGKPYSELSSIFRHVVKFQLNNFQHMHRKQVHKWVSKASGALQHPQYDSSGCWKYRQRMDHRECQGSLALPPGKGLPSVSKAEYRTGQIIGLTSSGISYVLVLLNPFRNVALDDRASYNLSSQPHSLCCRVLCYRWSAEGIQESFGALGQKICRMATIGHIAKLSSGPEKSFQQIDILDWL